MCRSNNLTLFRISKIWKYAIRIIADDVIYSNYCQSPKKLPKPRFDDLGIPYICVTFRPSLSFLLVALLPSRFRTLPCSSSSTAARRAKSTVFFVLTPPKPVISPSLDFVIVVATLWCPAKSSWAPHKPVPPQITQTF